MELAFLAANKMEFHRSRWKKNAHENKKTATSCRQRCCGHFSKIHKPVELSLQMGTITQEAC
jgi:hypothetical protein